MDTSIFFEKTDTPTEEAVRKSLGPLYELWIELKAYVREKYPAAVEEWNFPGKKYGWHFRMKDKKRAIMYFTPFNGNFRVSFVFGHKAVDQILATDISEEIKTDLQNAQVYAEGRGILIYVNDRGPLADIKKLVDIKLRN